MTSRHPFFVSEDDSPAKRAILQAALKRFGERGLAETSIRAIAEESGYSNPALYKHFAGKDELALYLFEKCHAWVWTAMSTALERGDGFAEKLDSYVGAWLELLDKEPQVLAFLSDSARVLWPRAHAAIRQKTMIGLARSLVDEAPGIGRPGRSVDPDIAAASIQGTLAELGRMVQVGVVRGPAIRWRGKLVTLFRQLAE